MYLTAHLVRSPEGRVGINAFLHLHVEMDVPRDRPDVPDVKYISQFCGGYDVARDADVPSGGNSVFAYLDIASADDASEDSVQAALDLLEQALPADPLPVVKSSRGVSVQAGAVLMYDENRPEFLGVFRRLRERCTKLLQRRQNARPEGCGPYVVLRVVTELDVEFRLPPETAIRLPRTITQARLVPLPRDLPVEQGGVLVEDTLVALLGRTRTQISAVGGVKVLEARTGREVAHLLHD